MSPVCFVKHVPGTLRSSAPRARKGFPQSSALRCAPFVQTKGLSTPAALRSKPWVIPLPLQLLPPQAWAWAKALLCEQQQQNHLRAKTRSNTDEQRSYHHRKHCQPVNRQLTPAAAEADRERSNRSECASPDRAVGAGTQRGTYRL